MTILKRSPWNCYELKFKDCEVLTARPSFQKRRTHAAITRIIPKKTFRADDPILENQDCLVTIVVAI